MTIRTTLTLEKSLVEQARRFRVDISVAAREGVASAVRAAEAKADQRAYEEHPESPDPFWIDAEPWIDS